MLDVNKCEKAIRLSYKVMYHQEKKNFKHPAMYNQPK